MTGTLSYEELHKRVTRLQEGALGCTQVERKAVWDHLMCHPLIDRLPAGFAIFNEDFVLLNCNRVYAEYIRLHTPYTLEQALGMSHFDYKPGSLATSAPWFRHVRDSRQGETSYDFELQTLRGGQYVRSYWDVHMSPVVNQCGMLAGNLMCCIDVTERRATKKALQQKEESLTAKSRSIEEMKVALKVLLAFRAQHQNEQGQRLLADLGQNLLPWIERLKRTRLDAEQKVCVEIIESKMVDIASSFAGIMSSRVPNLTRTEIQVAQLVKLGKTSKEIASLLGVSKECIDFHRNNLRKKLGLCKQKVNLTSHLCSLSQQRGDEFPSLGDWQPQVHDV